MMAETYVFSFGSELWYLKLTSGGWLLHSCGGSFGSSPWNSLNCLIFCLSIIGRKLGPRMIHEYALWPIIPQYSQIIFVYHVDLNGRLKRSCTVVVQMTKTVRAMTWRSQVSWIYKHFQIMVDIMDLDICVDFCHLVVVKEVDEVCNFRCDNGFEL